MAKLTITPETVLLCEEVYKIALEDAEQGVEGFEPRVVVDAVKRLTGQDVGS